MNLAHIKHVHFVGVGGAGVGGLARIALGNGLKVTGSDTTCNDVTEQLAGAGATIWIGHRRDHVAAGCGLVVASAAIDRKNPERREAERRGIRVVKYAEALGQFTLNHTNLCVAGTHGKTTATAMLAQVLVESGKNPGYLIGGEPVSLPFSAAAGDGVHFVLESCEYDRSFLKLHPSLILLNNIEPDHLDIYGDLQGVVRGFMDFVTLLPDHGTLIYNADDAACIKIAKQARCHTVGFGESPEAHWRIEELRTTDGFADGRVTCRGMAAGHLRLEVPGRVNALNALGALAAANWAGIPTNHALRALQNFKGVKRRFEIIGSIGGIPLVDDYAHHPTAVKQLLETAKATFKGRRIVAVFQAHQYQRINGFFDEFAEALAQAPRVLIARTYAARENGIVPGEPEERLAKELRRRGVECMAYGDFAGIHADLSLKTARNDAVIFIGAGNINQVAYDVLKNRSIVSARFDAIRPAELSPAEDAA